MKFSNTYARLDSVFYEKKRPTPVRNPRLLLWNTDLADHLMISKELTQDLDALGQAFSGNQILPGSEPIAMAYAGHQFGHFVPQLGDGRAHLLGEVLDKLGHRRDIQLKGSGPTQFSRRGDGRCAIGPAVREFIMSEAMNALGVPTTRCLAVVTTGERVFRESSVPGAIVTRVASSHLRIGTFQYFAAREDQQSLKTLCDYTIKRHYPELEEEGANRYLLLIDKAIERQVHLITEWMRVGFIHGVMNTDNVSLSGETIDYGPCAMMGVYNPETVYSSIDTTGRYAFGNQPEIAQWNIVRFAECLLPLINSDVNKAIEQVEPLLTGFPGRFKQAHLTMMRKKLGLTTFQQDDQNFIFSVLDRLKEKSIDYTIIFDLLTRSLVSESAATQAKGQLEGCFHDWQKRLSAQGETPQEVQKLMRKQNPMIIPRNHQVEAIIKECEQAGKTTLAKKFLHVFSSPYEEHAHASEYQEPPDDRDAGYQTFCGT